MSLFGTRKAIEESYPASQFVCTLFRFVGDFFCFVVVYYCDKWVRHTTNQNNYLRLPVNLWGCNDQLNALLSLQGYLRNKGKPPINPSIQKNTALLFTLLAFTQYSEHA